MRVGSVGTRAKPRRNKLKIFLTDRAALGNPLGRPAVRTARLAWLSLRAPAGGR
jgi:hypothetical protein